MNKTKFLKINSFYERIESDPKAWGLIHSKNELQFHLVFYDTNDHFVGTQVYPIDFFAFVKKLYKV